MQEGEAFVLVLNKENNDMFHLQKVKLNIGKETEDAIEIINAEVLKDKQILVKGIGMLLNTNQ